MKRQNSRITAIIRGMYRRNASASFALGAEVLQGLGTELGRIAATLLLEGRHQELLDLQANPLAYQDVSTFRDDYLAVEMMSKYPYLDLHIDREAIALQKFRDSEKQCSETNKSLSRYPLSSCKDYGVESFIWMAQLKIASLLGSFSWDLAEPYFGFGPGSTTSLPKRRGDTYFKFGVAKPHVTKACSVLSLCAIKRIPRWFSHLVGLAGETLEAIEELPPDLQVEKLLTIVPGNRVTTVPKNAKTDRCIAIEPDMNMYIQKGIGSLIRSRLKRVGIDLDNQSRNQNLAQIGSLTGSLCTIDLSSASDTVAMQLCERLLPADWMSAIKLCRSPRGILPSNEIISYEKVSSMGNGFTFELESLIFWALCSSVISLLRPSESRLSVYGDDIICSSHIYEPVTEVLSYCGFTVNMKKSFATGPFRESCGKHFFEGVDVTPFYIRKDIDTPDRLIWMANSIRRWARTPYFYLDGRLKVAYDHCVGLLPEALQRPMIPEGYGDLALFGDLDEACPKFDRRLYALMAIGVSDIRDTFVPGDVQYMLRSLYLLERRGPSDVTYCTGASNGVIASHHRRHWKCIKFPVTQWESYGNWLIP